MISTRRIPYNISLPRAKSRWLDDKSEAQKRRPSELIEELVDRAMEQEQGAKSNGTHEKQPARARA